MRLSAETCSGVLRNLPPALKATIYECFNVNAVSFRSAGVSFSVRDEDDDADAVSTLFCCLELLFGL